MALSEQEIKSFGTSTDQSTLEYGEQACLETPRPLFEKLHREFNFQVDLFANEQNHHLPVWYGPGGVDFDSLTAAWSDINHRRRGFGNPPYGRFIPKALQKAIHEKDYGFTSVFLLPMQASGWYQNLVLPYADEVRHVKERVTFWYHGAPKINPKTGKADCAMFWSILVVYRPHPIYRHRGHGESVVCPFPDHGPAAKHTGGGSLKAGCPHMSVWSQY